MDERRQRYTQHKANAKRRGIEFDMTFEEWWEIWENHFDKRGAGAGQLQMCRTKDEGGYKPSNVRIDTREANAQELRATLRRRAVLRAWTFDEVDISRDHDGWMSARNRQYNDYFKERIRAEKLAEQENENGA